MPIQDDLIADVPSGKIELTDRELAIARGENPDALTPAIPEATPEPVVEANSPESLENSASESGKEAAGSTTEATAKSWLTPEYRELANSYGFNEEDLKDLASPDEFRRATKLIDRQLMAGAEAFRKANQPQSQPAQATPPAAPTASQNAANATAVANAQAAAKLAKLDVEELRKKGFDEDSLGMIANQNQIIDEFTQLQNKFEQVNVWASQMQQMQQMRETAAKAEAFHDAVDNIKDPRFGKSLGDDGRPVQLTAEQDALRRKLYETAETLAVGIVTRARAMGVPPEIPPLPSLLTRAHQLAFAGDIRAEERGKVHQEIREQSMKRRPVAAARAPNGQYVPPDKTGPKSINDLVNEVSNNPDVMAAYKKALEASGAAA